VTESSTKAAISMTNTKAQWFPLALFTRDILTHNIAIKIYCDKKTFFIQYFFSQCELKIFISVYLNRFWNATTIFWQKKCHFIFLLQYIFIFLSQYCVQKYCVWIRPKFLTYHIYVEKHFKSILSNCHIVILYLLYIAIGFFHLLNCVPFIKG